MEEEDILSNFDISNIQPITITNNNLDNNLENKLNFTEDQIKIVEFFEKEGLNLYNVNDKKKPIKKDGFGFSWSDLTINDVGPDKYYPDRSIGFLSGPQFRSGKRIIVLDFDIYDSSTDSENPKAKSLLVEFLKMDKKTNPMKIGHFTSSTCMNYGVLLDITSNKTLIDYLVPKGCKQGDVLEILIRNNVVLPPTTTICKKCKTLAHQRQFVNYDHLGFTPISDEIADWIKTYILKYEQEQKNKKKTSITSSTSISTSHPVINNLPTETVIKLIACISTDRLDTNYKDWCKITSIVYNTNNSKEVCKAFWERGKVGKYANVTYDEIESCFYSHNIYPDFDHDILVRIARYDNPTLFFQSFNKYDEPTFLHHDITFKDENNQDTKYINLDQLEKSISPGENMVVLKSPYGTGKTTMIKEIVNRAISKNPNSRIIFLVMRQSLARSIELDFESLGFINYLAKIHKQDTIDGDNTSIITNYQAIKKEIDHTTNRVIISLDSLPRINNYSYESQININPYDIVICDEFCSLLSHFSYKQMNSKEFIYKLFYKIIKSARKTSYFLDGDISNREIGFLENYLDYTGVPIFNKSKGNSFNVTITYDEDYYLKEIVDDLINGRNVCVIAMSSGFCDKLEAFLLKYGFTISSIFKITGKSSDIDKNNLKNVNTLFTLYRIVIFSPTITVGVDFNQEHFHKIYGQICFESVSPREYWQMLARIRKVKDPNILILAPNQMVLQGLYYCKTIEDIKNININTDDKINGLRYIETWNKWESDNKRFFLDIFKWYGENKGHTINIPILKSKSDNPLKIEKETIRKDKPKKRYVVKKFEIDECKDVMIVDFTLDSVYNAKLLDNEEIVKVVERTKNNIATKEDKLNYEKTIYYNAFKLDPNITKDKFEEYYRKLHILKGYNLYIKLEDNKFKIYTLDLEYQSKFDKDILRNKLNYFNTIKKIINFNNKNFIKKSDFDLISDNLVTIFKDDYFRNLYNIEKDRNYDKTKSYYNRHIIDTVNIIFNEVGFLIKKTSKRIVDEVCYCYEFEKTEIINKYLEPKK